jgi:very-short-patch-repair endonuclease
VTLVYNRKIDEEKRKKLRKNMTLAEIVLWKKIKNRQVLDQKFVRQYSVVGFVIDFYCRKLKLAIEVDGSIHNTETARVYDLYREKVIKFYGVSFIRFTNEEVLEDMNNVIIRLKEKIYSLTNISCQALLDGKVNYENN